jgi:hypothetical protein
VDTTGPDIPVYRAIPDADGVQFPMYLFTSLSAL